MDINLKFEKENLIKNIETLETLSINCCLSAPEKILDVNSSDVLRAIKHAMDLFRKKIKSIEDYEEKLTDQKE